MIADPITLTVLGVLVGVRACTLDNSRLFHVSPHADHRGRTYNLALKRRLLWPIELRRRVPVAGIEPAACRLRVGCSSG